MLSPQKASERQIMKTLRQPRFRLACKTAVGEGLQNGETGKMTIRINPRQPGEPRPRRHTPGAGFPPSTPPPPLGLKQCRAAATPRGRGASVAERRRRGPRAAVRERRERRLPATGERAVRRRGASPVGGGRLCGASPWRVGRRGRGGGEGRLARETRRGSSTSSRRDATRRSPPPRVARAAAAAAARLGAPVTPRRRGTPAAGRRRRAPPHRVAGRRSRGRRGPSRATAQDIVGARQGRAGGGDVAARVS